MIRPMICFDTFCTWRQKWRKCIGMLQADEVVFFQSEGNGISGYIGDIWNTMADVLNFSLNVNDVSNLNFDLHRSNGNWTALLDELQHHHIHVIPHLLMDNNRRNVADFTQPFATLGVQLMVKSKAVSHFSWLWPFTPFSVALWQAVITFVISISAILHFSLWTVKKLFPRSRQLQHDFFGNFLYIYGFFCSQGSAPRSFLTSIKIMVLWTSLLAYVLIQSYGATLVSHITAVTSWEAPFNNLEGLLQSQYSLAVVSGSNIHSELKKLKGDVYEAVWKNAVKMVNSDQQAFHEVCYGRVASFVTSEMNSANNYCKMISVSHLYFSSWSSSGLVKDFPCKHLIDITILRLRESGILNILMIRHPSHFWKQEEKRDHPSSKFEGSVQLLQVAPILSLYAFGIMLALFVLLLERATATRISDCSHNSEGKEVQPSQSVDHTA
ncbi:glutamate receptor ionotropic, kainate 4 isoform X3 [Cryptotermes secundus]|nr:glutamate receptor ionotropic, kainate 4 isoform X3 [Cryptotermes secundus]